MVETLGPFKATFLIQPTDNVRMYSTFTSHDTYVHGPITIFDMISPVISMQYINIFVRTYHT